MDGAQEGGDFRPARIAGDGEGDEGTQALLELEGGGGRGASRGEIEIQCVERGVAQSGGEGDRFGDGDEIVGVGEIAFEGERSAAADGDPDGVMGGRGPGCGENGGGRVRRVGGGDEAGRAEEGDIVSAGDGQEFGAGGGDEEGVRAAEGLEKAGNLAQRARS